MNIVTITTPPTLTRPIMQRGITSKDGALRWAKKNGVETVYWLERKEQVYAEKPIHQPVIQACVTPRDAP